MRSSPPRPPVRRLGSSSLLGVCLTVLGALVLGCGSGTPSARPSQSLSIVDFTPLPTDALPSVAPTRSPGRTSALNGSWPVGWDVSFCTAFADVTVAHQLVIDIERAIADENRSDAQGLANELAQTVPVASNEVGNLKDWAPAAELKTDMSAMLDLDAQAAAAYQSYFNDDVKTALKQARQLRNQVSKQVDPVNAQLATLAGMGLACPDTDLTFESF